MLKRQWFEDSKSEKTEPWVSKRQRIGVHNNEKGLSLDKYEDEGRNVRYVPLLFVAPLSP